MLPSANDTWDRAREWHNPLRHFTLARAISLAEAYPRGEFADLMWTMGAPFNGIETADADLLAIIERRTSALGEMDWNAKPKTGKRIDTVLAAEQEAAVHELMDGIDNLYEAITHLALSFVRGFAHVEIIETASGAVSELRAVDQWHVTRRGIRGGWRYNPEAKQTNWDALGAELDMPTDRFVIREVARPVGRIALLKFARQALNDADWGAYVERYGIASGVVTMPPDVPEGEEETFLAAAQAVAEAASGALPHGATWSPNSPDKGSGTAPFSDRLEWLSEKLVLAGTGGKLTMLAESGSGTLAGGAHQEAFDQLARGDARAIGEVLTKQLVNPWLRKAFPGRPISAYFEMAFREEVDGSAVVEDAVALAGAGYRVDATELSEKTGLKLATEGQGAQGAGQEDADGRANTVQLRADAPEAAAGVSTAAGGNRPSEGVSDAKVKNRAPEGVPDGTKAVPSGREAAAEVPPVAASSGGDAAVEGDRLEAMLARLLRGGVEAWTDALAEAAADGVEADLPGGQESEDGGQKSPAAKMNPKPKPRKAK